MSESRKCDGCEYEYDNCCTLTEESVQTTICHYDEAKEFESDIMREVSK